MENIGIIIVTAIVTTVFHGLLWKFQFSHEEKSDYRKLYHKRKLEIYEGIYNKLQGEFARVWEAIVVSLDEKKEVARLEAQNRLNEHAKNIVTYAVSNSLYISPKIMDCIAELCSQIYIVGSNIAKEEVIKPTGISDLTIKVATLGVLMQRELGIQEVLDSSIMEKILGIREPKQ